MHSISISATWSEEEKKIKTIAKGAQREAEIHQQTSYIHKICQANGTKKKNKGGKKQEKKGLTENMKKKSLEFCEIEDLCNKQWLIGADSFGALIRCTNICCTAGTVYNNGPQCVHNFFSSLKKNQTTDWTSSTSLVCSNEYHHLGHVLNVNSSPRPSVCKYAWNRHDSVWTTVIIFRFG